MEAAKRAFFCGQCHEIDFSDMSVYCAQTGCACEETAPLETILDVYSNFYYLLDHRNLAEYETLAAERPDRLKVVKSRLEAMWAGHLQGKTYAYQRKAYLALLPKTRELLRESIQQATDRDELLLVVFVWLLLLDEKLQPLRDSLIRKGEPLPLNAWRGPLMLRPEHPLTAMLEQTSQFAYSVDVNFLSLRRKIQHIYLCRPRYPMYSVTHRRLPSLDVDETNIGDVTMGFIPGYFDLCRDYTFEVKTTPDDWDPEGRAPFVFTGVADAERYAERMLRAVDTLLERDCDWILLPELIAPLEVQQRTIQRVKEKWSERSRLGGRMQTSLLATGSFHVRHAEIAGGGSVTNPDRIYNYGQIVDGRGDRLTELFKMNRFVLTQHDSFSGPLTHYKSHDGIERNAYDRREITIFESAMGRIAFFICVDFINSTIEEVLLDRGVNWIIVLSFTPNPAGGKFLRRMQELGERNRAVVIVCNHLGQAPSPDAGDVSGENNPKCPLCGNVHSTGRPKAEPARVVAYLPGMKGVFRKDAEWLIVSLGEIVTELSPKKKDKL